MKKHNINYTTNDVNKASWHSNDEFYKYLSSLWESSKEAVLSLNDSSMTAEDKKRCLEDWYELTCMRFDAIYFFFEGHSEEHYYTKAKDYIISKINEIKEISAGEEFFLISRPEDLVKIKDILIDLRRILTRFEFEFELVMKIPEKPHYEDAFA